MRVLSLRRKRILPPYFPLRLSLSFSHSLSFSSFRVRPIVCKGPRGNASSILLPTSSLTHATRPARPPLPERESAIVSRPLARCCYLLSPRLPRSPATFSSFSTPLLSPSPTPRGPTFPSGALSWERVSSRVQRVYTGIHMYMYAREREREGGRGWATTELRRAVFS